MYTTYIHTFVCLNALYRHDCGPCIIICQCTKSISKCVASLSEKSTLFRRSKTYCSRWGRPGHAIGRSTRPPTGSFPLASLDKSLRNFYYFYTERRAVGGGRKVSQLARCWTVHLQNKQEPIMLRSKRIGVRLQDKSIYWIASLLKKKKK